MTALVKIAPGYIVIDVSSATGGVTYDREVLTDTTRKQARRIEFQTIKRIDHETLVREINAAVKEVDHVLRKLCVRTPFGHFAATDILPQVTLAVAALADQMAELNQRAEAAGSGHRGRVGVVTAYLDVARPENLRECYRVIREVLLEVFEALRAGDVTDDLDGKGNITRRHSLRPIMLRTRNLETMAVGLPGTAIAAALARAKTAKAEILKAVKAGAEPGAAGQAVDLQEIETAIAWFDEGRGV